MPSRTGRPAGFQGITRGIRDYLSRDWAGARDAKDRYWAERIQRLGCEEAFRVADELRRHAVALDPRWPHPDERHADLDAHARLAERFARASRARRH